MSTTSPPQLTTIVIIDDDPDSCALLGEAVAAPDRIVFIYTDPVQAMVSMTQAPPDLVITDLNMPWLDGAGVVARHDLFPETEMLMVSGSRRAGRVARRFGVEVLQKPVQVDVLNETVDTLLATRQERIRRAAAEPP